MGYRSKNESPFLTAEWRHLVMVNYRVDPAILKCRLPAGTELDSFQDATYVSLVAFNFLNTRVKSLAIPFHQDFEEINLRFYVRRWSSGEWKRGVVFVKEIVPKHAIAWVARVLYNENYVALPTRHCVNETAEQISVRYEWKHQGCWNYLAAQAAGEPKPAGEGTIEQFISEHYWGYTTQRDGGTKEYEVQHPSWKIWRCPGAEVQVDVAALYGNEFVEALARPPASVFIADGSTVSVGDGNLIAQGDAHS